MNPPRNKFELPENIFAGKQEKIEEKTPRFNPQKLLRISALVDRITGISAAISLNLLVLALAGSYVIFNSRTESNEVTVSVIKIDARKVEKVPDYVNQDSGDASEQDDAKTEKPEIEAELCDLAVSEIDNLQEPGEGNSALLEKLDLTISNSMFAISCEEGMNGGKGIGGAYSSTAKSGSLTGRIGGKRDKYLQEYGGGRRTERAVEKGLKWLVKHQNEDGSWGKGEDVDIRLAVSGLAALAFLAHGETASSQEYGATVMKSLHKLVEYSKGRKITINPDGFGHALLTYALAEAYAMTNIPALKEELDKRASIIVKRVNAQENNITSCSLYRNTLSGWNYQALRAAYTAGSSPEGMNEAIDKSIESIIEKSRQEGKALNKGANAEESNADPAMLFVRLFCLQIFGEGNSATAEKYLRRIVNHDNGVYLKCDWKKAQPWALYLWYYQHQAVFMGYAGKGAVWKKWNGELSNALLNNQEEDGSWLSPMQKSAKTADGETVKTFKSEEDLAVYSTALCTLMLEIYYRYLPTYKFEREKAVVQKPAREKIDGLVIE